MLNVTVENIGELAVVECEGRIVQREAALKLRQAVTSQSDARIVVLELSEVHAIEGGGLGMLVFLRRWARDHNIRFLLFNPSKSVRSGLKRIRSISEFYIPTMDEVMGPCLHTLAADTRWRLEPQETAIIAGQRHFVYPVGKHYTNRIDYC
jgi:anti-anti-sigma regulatory factor